MSYIGPSLRPAAKEGWRVWHDTGGRCEGCEGVAYGDGSNGSSVMVESKSLTCTIIKILNV